MSTNPQELPEPPSPGTFGRQRRGDFFVGWVYGPWVAASLISVLALRLLLDGDGATRGAGWGVFGSAAICFSIGCVCKTSWALAQRRR